MGTPHSPRSDTRARIIEVSLELFSEQGYEQTSLREIADRLGVTKAALYYHFKTKDDIVLGIVERMAAPIDETIAWGRTQAWSPEMRDELIRRFADGMAERAPLLRFFHENQPALRESPAGLAFRERIITMMQLVHGPQASFQDRLRAAMTLFTIHSSMFLLQQDAKDCDRPENVWGEKPPVADLDEALEAARTVALEVGGRITHPAPPAPPAPAPARP
ncbi:TetR family transcriptional regulator [Streptomyces sp. 1114.5]|uniref:TetR/AcrR family transcriptional regulator n=1 Tax=unclassified Streptomyces TaxID=2593676 RepID=UPI000BC8B922|nr:MULTISPECIES: TetR/AcrR family transcriptional regulator [unclassified Streptomyces]RKT17218.1 TetR family transcriptional regulator [Streptomyces sp. 1114.5]SOB83425.1 transcriptional regulator, TetR family [Streptomyces sp. 1331.2]